MKQCGNSRGAILYAVLAAVLYAISTPLSKLIMNQRHIASNALAAYLYLGAGIGMLILGVMRSAFGGNRQPFDRISKSDIPYVVLMILLDIAAPILLLAGLSTTNAETVSLLNNFEIVATSLIAALFFSEKLSARLWMAIALICVSTALLSVEGIASFKLSIGVLYVLLACCCWGLENNCTRRLSHKDPLKVVVIKGFGSGVGCLGIACFTNSVMGDMLSIVLALLLGFAAYGLSIFFYVSAQRTLGAAKTGAYYGIAPFIGAAIAFILFKELPSYTFLIAIVIMAAGVYLTSTKGKNGDGKKMRDCV